MGKKIYGFILFVYLCIAVSAGEFRKGRESNTINIITINTSRVINRFEQNPIGLNLNYFIDNDKVSNPSISLADAIKRMGVRYLRYPGGDKSDNNLFSVPPYEKAIPSLSRKGKGTSMGREAFLTDNESAFKFEPLNFDDFMSLCQETSCEPIIVVPCDSRKNSYSEATYLSTREQLIEHAAEWVRYANKKHHYNVKYWMVGNESWHPSVMYGGYSADDYGEDVRDFSDAMKAVAPTIKIIPNVASDVEAVTKSVFEKAGGKFDMLCISNYPIRTYKNGYEDWVAKTRDLIFPFRGVLEQIKKYSSTPEQENLKIIVAEYGPFDWWDGWGANADMGHAMCNFDILGKLLEQPKMAAGCFWNTRWMLEPNPWPGFNAFDNNNNFHPIAYSVSFWANHLYPEMVECSTDLNTLIAYSTYSRDEKAAYVYLINQGSDEARFELNLEGWQISAVTRLACMVGKSSDDLEPEIFTMPVKESQPSKVPAYSISIYKINIV